MFNNVESPYPGRRLKNIVSVQVKGKLLCWHRYNQIGFHEETVDYENKEPIRVSIRHYKCCKCGRIAFVFGPADQRSIETTIEKYKKKRRVAP